MYDENLILHLMGESARPQASMCPDVGTRPDVMAQCPHGVRPLAMVYSPKQEWRDLYENEEGHGRGTIFKELEFPFLGGVPRD